MKLKTERKSTIVVYLANRIAQIKEERKRESQVVVRLYLTKFEDRLTLEVISDPLTKPAYIIAEILPLNLQKGEETLAKAEELLFKLLAEIEAKTPIIPYIEIVEFVTAVHLVSLENGLLDNSIEGHKQLASVLRGDEFKPYKQYMCGEMEDLFHELTWGTNSVDFALNHIYTDYSEDIRYWMIEFEKERIEKNFKFKLDELVLLKETGIQLELYKVLNRKIDEADENLYTLAPYNPSISKIKENVPEDKLQRIDYDLIAELEQVAERFNELIKTARCHAEIREFINE